MRQWRLLLTIVCTNHTSDSENIVENEYIDAYIYKIPEENNITVLKEQTDNVVGVDYHENLEYDLDKEGYGSYSYKDASSDDNDDASSDDADDVDDASGHDGSGNYEYSSSGSGDEYSYENENGGDDREEMQIHKSLRKMSLSQISLFLILQY